MDEQQLKEIEKRCESAIRMYAGGSQIRAREKAIELVINDLPALLALCREQAQQIERMRPVVEAAVALDKAERAWLTNLVNDETIRSDEWVRLHEFALDALGHGTAARAAYAAALAPFKGDGTDER